MDELTVPQMPHSLEAERSVIGSMLINSQCIADVLEILKPSDFYLQENRDIFTTIYSMFSQSLKIDPVTLVDQMKQKGLFDAEKTDSYLLQIIEMTPTSANVKQYAQIVADKSLLRSIGQAGMEITEMVTAERGSAQSIMDAAEQKIYNIRNGRTNQDLEHIGQVLLELYELLAERAHSDSTITGLSTGLRDLDAKISGLNKGNLIIIGARPGMGKTSIALNIALSVAKSSKKAVVFFTLEMAGTELATRLLSNESFVDSQVIQSGKLTEEQWDKVGSAAFALSQTNLLLNVNPSITVTDMVAKCRRVDNLGLVIIDYLQLMNSADGKVSENRVTTVSEISRALKIMAKDLNVPVICLSQLNRPPSGSKVSRPTLTNLRESGSIEQDADAVILLHREDYYDENAEEKNVAECIIAKNRHGETATVKLQWLPQFTTFSDREWKHGEG